MTPDEIRAVVLDVLAGIAPEADLASLDPGADLRREIDLDSMDYLNLMIGLHERLGVEIPEADYPQLATLAGAVHYLARRGATRP